MAMRGKKVNFNKVLGMINNMIALLGQEQSSDDEKKTYCTTELDSAEDEKKTLADTISDTKKTIANTHEMVGTLNDEILKVAKDIKALNKAVADATAIRKDQNTNFVEELSSNNAAIQILNIAKNRLNDFYNPKLADQSRMNAINSQSQTSEVQLNDRDTNTVRRTSAQVSTSSGASAAVQDAFSFLQTAEKGHAKSHVAPGAAPSGFTGEAAASEGAAINALLDRLIADTEKQVMEMKAEEKNAQFEYEQFMKDSSEKRATEAKSLSAKES